MSVAGKPVKVLIRFVWRHKNFTCAAACTCYSVANCSLFLINKIEQTVFSEFSGFIESLQSRFTCWSPDLKHQIKVPNLLHYLVLPFIIVFNKKIKQHTVLCTIRVSYPLECRIMTSVLIIYLLLRFMDYPREETAVLCGLCRGFFLKAVCSSFIDVIKSSEELWEGYSR